MKALLVLVFLVAGFVFFGSIVVVEPGLGIYIKRSPSLDYAYVDAGKPPYNLERLLLMLNRRYSLMLIGYSEKNGLRMLESLPALP